MTSLCQVTSTPSTPLPAASVPQRTAQAAAGSDFAPRRVSVIASPVRAGHMQAGQPESSLRWANTDTNAAGQPASPRHRCPAPSVPTALAQPASLPPCTRAWARGSYCRLAADRARGHRCGRSPRSRRRAGAIIPGLGGKRAWSAMRVHPIRPEPFPPPAIIPGLAGRCVGGPGMAPCGDLQTS